jgi:hypothetical protein
MRRKQAPCLRADMRSPNYDALHGTFAFEVNFDALGLAQVRARAPCR